MKVDYLGFLGREKEKNNENEVSQMLELMEPQIELQKHSISNHLRFMLAKIDLQHAYP